MLKSIFAEVEASLEENKKASEPPVPNPRSEIKEERRERRRRRSSTSRINHPKSPRQEDNSAIEFMLDEFAQRGRFANRHAEDKENENVMPSVSETAAPDNRIRRKYVHYVWVPTLTVLWTEKKCVKNQKPVSSAPCLMAPLKR